MYNVLRQRVNDFFERPKSGLARFVHIFIIFLIVLSAIMMIVEFKYVDLFDEYRLYFDYADYFVLGVFTLEYLFRLWSAPRRLKFIFRFYSLIDLFAIVPGYLQVANFAALRSLRLLRVLRFSRIFRVFRIFRYGRFFGALFSFKNTILEKILPVVLLFAVMKFCVFFLENNGWWLQDYNLETMFAIVGFALGIILSQKIGVAYGKFIILEDASIKVHGLILTLHNVLSESKKNTKVLGNWLEVFHDILLRKKKRPEFYDVDAKLYKELHSLIEKGKGFEELVSVYADLNKEASYMMNRMDALTPLAYDQILHQATLIYSFLLIIFMPGVTGIVSTLIATYVLYGMYQVTADMDQAMTHLEDDLINADIEDLTRLRERLGRG